MILYSTCILILYRDIVWYLICSPGDLVQYNLVSRTPGDLIQYNLISRTPGDLIQYNLVSKNTRLVEHQGTLNS